MSDLPEPRRWTITGGYDVAKGEPFVLDGPTEVVEARPAAESNADEVKRWVGIAPLCVTYRSFGRASLPVPRTANPARPGGEPSEEAMEAGLRWRTGRKVGRTIYAQVGSVPSDGDVLIGMMDTVELAEEAVNTRNSAVDAVSGKEGKDG